MFPDELPRRLIKMFSFISETVLDPFLGSGTTSRVARKLKRNSIGYEVNKTFLPIIEDKIGKNEPPLFDQRDVIEVVFQNRASKESISNNSRRNTKNNKMINNRIRHPEYWKELKR